MASASPSIRTRMYKFESIRIEWIIHFQKNHPADYYTVKNFLDNFHENHGGFEYAVGRIFDGTTHVLVSPKNYILIKDELEKITGKQLPEVSTVSDVCVSDERLILEHPRSKSYRKISYNYKSQNDEIKQRKKLEAANHLRELDRALETGLTGDVMAFDVEVYEHNHSILLEIGFVLTSLTNPEDQKFFHFIIEDNLHLKNKDFVPDNRERFQFGTSQRMSLKDAAESFRQHVAAVSVLVTHSGSNDAEYLDKYGISLAGKPQFDTQLLALALTPQGPHVRSLKGLLNDLEIPFDEDILHNAGNDAFYTMKVFVAMKDKLERKRVKKGKRRMRKGNVCKK